MKKFVIGQALVSAGLIAGGALGCAWIKDGQPKLGYAIYAVTAGLALANLIHSIGVLDAALSVSCSTLEEVERMIRKWKCD